MLVMIDMNLGNLQSVVQAFRTVGAEVTVTSRPADVRRAAAVILPGVGAFGDGMASLRAAGLIDALRGHVLGEGRPLLGICLGMQLLAEEGEEHGLHRGLGLVPGRCVRLVPGAGERVPNIGWCDVRVARPGSVLFHGAREAACFYFAHGYHVHCADTADIAATLPRGGSAVTAAVERGALFGVQFHPEKSQDAGLELLAAFCRHAAVTPAALA
jgi:glutamine amidotransferase